MTFALRKLPINQKQSFSMCGRGRVCLSVQQIKKAGNVVDSAIDADNLRSINNFSPGMASPVVISRESDKTREVQHMTFGLIPHFTSAKDKPNHYIMFNASMCAFQD